MILTWENGRCTNAPEGWEIAISIFGVWETCCGWSAWKRGVPPEYSVGGFPTTEAAQADCEATLLVLGVLPLEWHDHGGEDESPDWMLQAGEFWARAEDGYWLVARNGRTLARSETQTGYPSLPAAKSTAETVLRVLLAAHLRGNNGQA